MSQLHMESGGKRGQSPASWLPPHSRALLFLCPLARGGRIQGRAGQGRGVRSLLLHVTGPF